MHDAKQRPLEIQESPARGSTRKATLASPFIDNRPETVARRQLSEAITNSPHGAAQRKLSDAITNSPSAVAQRKRLHSMFGNAIQLQGTSQENEILQPKFDLAQSAGSADEESLQGRFAVSQRMQKTAPPPNRTGLPDSLKSGIESLSGISLDSVSVHYNSSQPAQLNALAYAQGRDIHIAPGQEQHLPHEAWHVVQQAQGRVKPTTQLNDGIPVNDEAGLEREADVMGLRAAQFTPAITRQLRLRPVPSRTFQLESDYDGLVPSHVSYGDSYDFQGARSTAFTYHHIIPENRLKAVRKQIEAIIQYAPQSIAINTSALVTGKNDLIDGAKPGWKRARIQNVTQAINSEFSYLKLHVSQDEVGAIINQHAETAGGLLDLLFPAFVALLKAKLKTLYLRQKRAYIVEFEAACTAAEVQLLRKDPDTLLDNLLQHADPGPFYSKGPLAATIKGHVAYAIHPRIAPATVKKYAWNAIDQAWSFDDCFDTPKYAPIHQNVIGAGMNLKKILRDFALPHESEAHLTHAVQWNPGNLHRGPSASNRISRGTDAENLARGFKELFDDGGEDFEKAAVNLVSTQHYGELVALNTAIDGFLTPPAVTKVALPTQAKVGAAEQLLTNMRAIQVRGLTAFAPGQWQQHGDNKMRLIENPHKVAEAEAAGHPFVR